MLKLQAQITEKMSFRKPKSELKNSKTSSTKLTLKNKRKVKNCHLLKKIVHKIKLLNAIILN